jgi:hypothetical protein
MYCTQIIVRHQLSLPRGTVRRHITGSGCSHSGHFPGKTSVPLWRELRDGVISPFPFGEDPCWEVLGDISLCWYVWYCRQNPDVKWNAFLERRISYVYKVDITRKPQVCLVTWWRYETSAPPCGSRVQSIKCCWPPSGVKA